MDTLKVKVGDKWFKVDVVEFSPSRAVFLVDGDQITVTPSMVGQDQNQDKKSGSGSGPPAAAQWCKADGNGK